MFLKPMAAISGKAPIGAAPDIKVIGDKNTCYLTYFPDLDSPRQSNNSCFSGQSSNSTVTFLVIPMSRHHMADIDTSYREWRSKGWRHGREIKIVIAVTQIWIL